MPAVRLLRSAVNRIGYDIRRYDRHRRELRLSASLRAAKIDLVLDIGADVGLFGRMLRANGYSGRIISFEPRATAYAKLVEESKADRAWTAVHSAVGEQQGRRELNIAANGESSSFLPMLQAHRDAAPGTQYTGAVDVEQITVDAVLGTEPSQSVFVKVDVQGYEDRVIAGSLLTLNKIRGWQLELSLVPLYEGQKMMNELVAAMNDLGYDLWDIAPVFYDPVSARMLQCDGVFFSSDAGRRSGSGI